MDKTEIREDTEWTDFRWHNAPDQTQKRILLVGDSIVVGHGGYVYGLVKDFYSVDYFATSRCVSDVDYLTELDYMFSRRDYEMVVFNNGLHGFDIDNDIYIYHLKEVLKEMKSRVDKVIWRNSTPVRNTDNLECFNKERNPVVIQRNEKATTVAAELFLPVIDLYTPMSKQVDFFSPDGVHYNKEGREAQAKIIAEAIQRYFQEQII